MRAALLLGVIFYLLSSFETFAPLFIKPGKEVDGLKLENSTVEDAILKYGRYNDFSQGIACGTETVYTNRFTFSNPGITVISKTVEGIDKSIAKSKIKNIRLVYPCNAITEEGINLKNDNLDKILAIYGSSDKTDTLNLYIDLHYFSKGISFRCNRGTMNIQLIEIYQPDGQPEYRY